MWVDHHLDIVCVQETHLTMSTEGAAVRQLMNICDALHIPMYHSVWSHKQSNTAAAGVGILIRSDLINSGALVIEGQEMLEVGGRSLSLRIAWGGHSFRLVSVYLPTGDPAQQKYFIEHYLKPTITPNTQHIWAGDWNFTLRPAVDRMQRAPTAVRPLTSPTRHADVSVAESFTTAAPDMVDTFRLKHPQRKGYTYIHTNHASRLDRIHVSRRLSPYVDSADIASSSTSDHRPVFTTITARVAQTHGAGLPKTRTHFWLHSRLRDEFFQWLEPTLGAAPEGDDVALIEWWPHFKRSLAAKARSLNYQARALQLEAGQRVKDAQQELAMAHSQIDAGDGTALQRAIDARAKLKAAAAYDDAAAAAKMRYKWLHAGELPCPSITKIVGSHSAAQAHIPALRHPRTGALVTDPKQLADVVATFWAQTSAVPHVSAAAQQAVLMAVNQHSGKIPDDMANTLGCSEVDAAEVKLAMKKMDASRAPGPDGIPLQIYRKAKALFIPVLTALFCAIRRTGCLPTDFNLAAITSLFKKGSPQHIGNYRPISLLGFDYRILAKVLAHRLTVVLPHIIAKSQTAFLPGRQIGSNILTLQLLPQHLQLLGRAAVVVFCDFKKAYDTVDRGFLFQIMQAIGVGQGFMQWVNIMLQCTSAVAVVNGHTSKRILFLAGMRQGCPMSPPLYLMIGHALYCWLQHNSIGIDLEALRMIASQYADDTEAYLPSPQSIPAFLDVMRTFADASGQHLNLAQNKTEALAVGVVPATPEWQTGNASGMNIVTTTEALGMQFQSPKCSVAVDWTQQIENVSSVLTKLQRLRLSAFGRAFAASGYGISKFLYHAEYAGALPTAQLEILQQQTRMLVDQERLGNSGVNKKVPPGIDPLTLPGNPKEGGFGLLPWPEHITAREAVWGARLVASMMQTQSEKEPWHCMATDVIAQVAPGRTPLSLLTRHPPSRQALLAALPGDPLRRIMQALQALPPVTDVAADPVTPGDWCESAPLWHNPVLTAAREAAGLGMEPLEQLFPNLAALGMPATVGVALRCVPASRSLTVLAQTFPNATFDIMAILAPDIEQLVAALPPTWLVAAAVAIQHGGAETQRRQAALELIIPRLGWRLEGEEKPVTVVGLKVRQATRLQMEPIIMMRQSAHIAFLQEAGVIPMDADTDPDRHLQQLHTLFKQLWRIQWENARKEPFWRLTIDGFPKYHRRGTVKPCPCGQGTDCRQHNFWGCPVAQAVVTDIQRCLPHGTPLSCASLWLMQVPHRSVNVEVWRVVCLAAIGAMNQGHRQLWARHNQIKNAQSSMQREEARRRPLRRLWARIGITVPAGGDAPPQQWPQPADVAAVAGSRAVSDFWEQLVDFAHLQGATGAGSLGSSCSSAHPFLCVDDGKVRVRRPA